MIVKRINEVSYDEEKLLDLCEEYKINPEIPKFYISRIKSEERHTKLSIPCGTGKTVGLGIAMAACPDLYVIYVASNHKRLEEFQNILKKFMIETDYISQSKQLHNYTGIRVPGIIMTTSMLLQFNDVGLRNVYIGGRLMTVDRLLIIDECPNLFNPISFSPVDIAIFYKTCRDLNLIRSIDTVTPPAILTSALGIKLIRDLYRNGSITINFDLGLQISDKVAVDPKTDAEGRSYFISRAISHLGLEGKLDNVVDYVINEADLNDWITVVLSPASVFLDRLDRSIITDATSDLYSDLLPGKVETLGMNKEYNKYIEKVMDLNTLLDLYLFNIDKNSIIETFDNMIPKIQNLLKEVQGPTYLVTYNSCIYNGDGRDKVIKEDFFETLSKYYKTVYIHPDKDFILCRNSPNKVEFDDKDNLITEKFDLLISNYNRNRGSNIFRNCRNVILIGGFYQKIGNIQKLIEDNDMNVSPELIQENLAISDAIQEISRGCIRQRKEDLKQTIYLFGDKNWKNKVCKELNTELASYKHSEIDSIILKASLYIKENSKNSRKASALEIARRICEDSLMSDRGRISFKNEVKVLAANGEIATQYARPGEFIKIMTKELDYTEQEAEKVIDWS